MRALGFDNYEGVLKIYLAKHREVSSPYPPFNLPQPVQSSRAGCSAGIGPRTFGRLISLSIEEYPKSCIRAGLMQIAPNSASAYKSY
jgi:hypothetical protein